MTSNKKKVIKVFCFKLKNIIFSSIIIIFILCLLFFSKSTFFSAKNGLNLWANFVLPSLFPFFIATELIYYTNIIYYIGKLLNKFMRPIFNVPGIGAYPLIMGYISGYPVGAKIVSKLKEEHLITNIEAERLISFTNNSGPLFIISTVGVGLFANTTIGILLLITHILSSLSVGIIFRFWKSKNNYEIKNNDLNNKSFKKISYNNSCGDILSKSITNSINTIVLIGGFIVFFNVIITLLNKCYILDIASKFFIPLFHFFNINLNFCKPFLSGLLEVTNGIELISNIHIKTISINIFLTSFLLGIGGLSVLFQVLSITSKSHISIKPYILGKFLHAIFSVLYLYIIFKLFPFISLDI